MHIVNMPNSSDSTINSRTSSPPSRQFSKEPSAPTEPVSPGGTGCVPAVSAMPPPGGVPTQLTKRPTTSASAYRHSRKV
eukprot:7224-Heterococcus_DN1.PRE.2